MLLLSVVSAAQVMNTCSSTFYDTGGPDGNYSNNEDYLVTYCADNGGKMRALFKEFSLSSQSIPDTLYVYDGPSTFSNLIGKYSGSLNNPGEEFTINSLIRGNGACLTFEFKSGSVGTSSGWMADIYCLAPPQGGFERCNDEIDNDADGLVDQADPDCLIEPSVENCFVGHYYYIPPIWQLSTVNNSDLNGPASLKFSTRFPQATISVRTQDNSYNQSFTITNGNPLIQDIPLTYLQTSAPNLTQRDKGFIVSSDVPIEINYFTDGRLNKNHISIRGREGLGRGFRVGSQTNTRIATTQTVSQKEAHFISVMASEDDTDVTFEFDIPMTGISSPHTVRLDRGESYLIKDDDNNVSVSGALVSATKNIAVISGSQHTSAYGSLEKDGGMDQIIPASNAGTNYVLTRSGNDADQDYAIVVPIENGTNLFIDGAFIQTSTIDAGDYYQIPLDGNIGEPLYLRTSRPAMVYHISGQNGGNVGMAVVPPLGSCRGDNILEFSKLGSANEHLLTIVIPNGGINSLRLNGSAVSGIQRPVPGFPGFSTILLQETDLQNDNILTASTNFTAGFIAASDDAAVYSYLTSYRASIDFLDVATGLPIEYIELDTICNGSSFEYTFQVESCGAGHQLISIEESGMMGVAEIIDTAGLTIRFQSEGINTGRNFISVVVENNLGNRSSICLGFVVDDLRVDLGADLSTCFPEDFTLTANASGGEPPYSYAWSNGAISPSIDVRPASTTRYFVTITDQDNCEFVDDVNISVGAGPQVVCFDQINISLNELCESEITPDLLLQNDHGIEDLFTVELTDQWGFIIPDAVVNEFYIGKTITYTVRTACNNTCWGQLLIEDKYIPLIECDNYTISCAEDASPDSVGYPVPFEDPIIVDDRTFILSGVDACSDVTLSYTDNIVEQDCNTGLERIIYRYWKVVDESGNQNACTDTINVLREDIDDLIFPLNRDDIELPSLACDSNYPSLPNGHPSTDPSAGGGLGLEGCDKIQVSFEDTYVEGCGTTFKILRHWRIFDWCTSETREDFQVIKITDKQPPTFVCPAPLTVYTSPYECNTGLIILPPPTMQDNCNETDFSAKIITDDHDPWGHPVDENNVTNGLPLGESTVEYYIFDACGNRDTCYTTITVEDDKAPFAIADLHTVASIGSDGTTRIYAENFDDGSFDNCGIKLMKVRKKTDSCGSEPGDYLYNDLLFNDYVDFCCAEVGDTMNVQFLVEDVHGNVNVVWVEVTLNDKLFPVVAAPPDLTISCNHGFYYDDLSIFGEVVINDEPRKPIIINDAFNSGTVGLDGYAVDNCYIEVSEEVELDLDCGKGTITRIFTAIDNNGMTDQDVQIITVADAKPFTEEQIIWPEKITIEGCVNVDIDTSVTGRPMYIDKNCAKLAAEYEDKIFEYGDGACLAIHRQWEVLDWCQYDPSTGIGLWHYVQVIYVENNVKPVFEQDYQDTTVCIYNSCEGPVEIEVNATDDCTEELFYKWRVDLDLDGIYDIQGLGNKINVIWEPGTYQVYWTVEDYCGNVAIEKYLVTVEDCKPPTPYCYSGIATAIMPQGGEIALWAVDYDNGSFDNCTPQENLVFSFSKDTTDTSFTVSCDQMGNGIQQLIPLKVWVTDEAGNQDFCAVEVKVNDNFDICPDTEIGYTDVRGEIVSFQNDIKMENVEMRMESDSDFQGLEFTDENGSYAFNNIPEGLNFKIRPVHDDAYRPGVSTLDIILIQKHILGLQRITDPYKLIAADVSNSQTVSGLDLIQIRKLILGLNKTFPKNTSWRFVDKAYDFPNPLEPWGFPEYIEMKDHYGFVYDADLIGIKIGDVNDSYQGSSNTGTVSRSAPITMFTSDKMVSAGERFELNFSLDHEAVLEGFQLALTYDPSMIKFRGITNGLALLRDEHLRVDEQAGRIYISFDDIEGFELDAGQWIYGFKMEALDDGLISEFIGIDNSELIPEVYMRSGEVRSIDLQFRTEGIESNQLPGLVVYQNKPNPFRTLTRLDFSLGVEEMINIQIFDISGRIILIHQESYSSGRQQFVIRNSDLPQPGVYYYKIIGNGAEETGKMIYVK